MKFFIVLRTIISFKNLCFVVLMSWMIDGFSQDSIKIRPFDIKFAQYLIDNNQYKEAEFVIDQHLFSLKGSAFSDTASYLKGMIYYRQMKLLESATNFTKIQPSSGYYELSHFLAGYEFAHLKNYEQSKILFESISSTDSLLIELKNFQLASLCLLDNKIESYRNYSNSLTKNYFQIKNEENEVESIFHKTENFKVKSPWLAGSMSAIIPGSGKIYAGKLGEGVTTLLGMTVLGLITYENYTKAGPTNYKTLVFGSLFTVFYFSNIYGSVYSVKVYRDEYYKSVQNAVLFNMHIPIRNIFKDSFN